MSKRGMYGLMLILAMQSSGCATMNIAEPGFYKEILNRSYKRSVYDCSDKARDYYNSLIRKGLEAKYHIGRVTTDPKNSAKHAWVTYKDENGIERLVDPTRKNIASGFPVEYYPQYHSERVITGILHGLKPVGSQ